MKKLAIALSLFSISILLPAQGYFEWSEPVIITDTNSVYSNPYVYSIGYTTWIFYEQNENHSSIHKMDLNYLEDNSTLLSSDTFNYKKPIFIDHNSTEYLGYLFYLSDTESAFNLYASKLYEDNTVGSSIKVIENVENSDIMDFTISTEGYIGYTIDSIVYAALLNIYNDTVYTEKITQLDTTSFNIQVDARIAFWQKLENDSSHIKYSNYKYIPDSGFSTWEIPNYADSTNDCRWLIKSKFVESWNSDEFCWVVGDTIAGRSGYNYFTTPNTINTFSQPNVRELSMINWFIAVKSTYEEPHFLCFTTGLGDSSEIYSSHGEFGWEEGAYISNNDYPDDNPEVYFGEMASGGSSGMVYNVYCIWQSHFGNKTALSMARSEAFIGSDIDENNLIDNHLRVSPTPFHSNLNIMIKGNNHNNDLKVYDVTGRIMVDFGSFKTENTWLSVEWAPNSDLKSGIYFVVLNADDKRYVKKVIYQ